MENPHDLEPVDVAIVGGGAAGLNGALNLVRSKRSVLVIDSGTPRNAPAHGVHGLLGHDGIAPAELLARGRAEVVGYGGLIVDGEVRGAGGTLTDGFTLDLANGRSVRARRVLLATGVVDRLPDLEGLREHWGGSVVHCPYCHGWEVRDRPIVVLGASPMSAHQAMLFSQLSNEVTYLTHDAPPDDDQRAVLDRLGVRVVEARARRVSSSEGRLSGLHLDDGTDLPAAAIAVATTLRARAEVATMLGVPVVEHSSGVATHVVADATGRTEVAGVWAAGNLTEPMAQVGASAAAGGMAGAAINMDLVLERAAG